MTTYRDQLVKQYGLETRSVAGCGLDRLGRPCSADEVALVVRYFQDCVLRWRLSTRFGLT